MEVVRERKKCFEIYFSNEVDRRKANEEYATFSAWKIFRVVILSMTGGT